MGKAREEYRDMKRKEFMVEEYMGFIDVRKKNDVRWWIARNYYKGRKRLWLHGGRLR